MTCDGDAWVAIGSLKDAAPGLASNSGRQPAAGPGQPKSTTLTGCYRRVEGKQVSIPAGLPGHSATATSSRSSRACDGLLSGRRRLCADQDRIDEPGDLIHPRPRPRVIRAAGRPGCRRNTGRRSSRGRWRRCWSPCLRSPGHSRAYRPTPLLAGLESCQRNRLSIETRVQGPGVSSSCCQSGNKTKCSTINQHCIEFYAVVICCS